MGSDYLAFDFYQRANFIGPQFSNTTFKLDLGESNVNLFSGVEMMEMIETKVTRATTQKWIEAIELFFDSIRQSIGPFLNVGHIHCKRDYRL